MPKLKKGQYVISGDSSKKVIPGTRTKIEQSLHMHNCIFVISFIPRELNILVATWNIILL